MSDLSTRTQAALAAIGARNDTLKAMISVNPEAMAEAEAFDAAAARGQMPAHGLVVSLKDNIDTANLRTTMGSSFYADHVPRTDAPVVQRLRRAGCVVVGKANLHEFAFGGTTQNPHHGLGRNPWNPDAIPGGSSGGSGSSVAAGMCEVSLGTDTGGSIRIPAALNGVAGLRPSVGRVPNTGCYPVSASHDTIGPLARTVADVARTYEIIAGYDAGDALSQKQPVESWINLYARGVAGLRIGLPRSWCLSDLEPDVADRFEEAIAVLASLGCQIVEITLEGAAQTQEQLMPMVHADAAFVHRTHLAEHPEGFGKDVLGRLEEGVALTSQGYAERLRFKERWVALIENVFSTVDIIVTPTCPVTAPLLRDAGEMVNTTRKLARFTYAWSLANTPALSVPVGFAGNGLPVGMQLVGPRWGEALVLALGAHFQAVTDHHTKRPTP